MKLRSVSKLKVKELLGRVSDPLSLESMSLAGTESAGVFASANISTADARKFHANK
jgi:hypothetical protein